MSKVYKLLLVFLSINLVLFAEEKSFAFSSEYNDAEYTYKYVQYESIEDAMKAPSDQVISLIVNARTKNMLAIKDFKNLKYISLDEGFTLGSYYMSPQALESFFVLCDQLPQLEYLSINDSRLLKYVKRADRFKGLAISKCDFNSMEANLSLYTNLEVLIINDNLAIKLAPVIGKLSSLKQLEIYTESLALMPDLEKLVNLQLLKAYVGKITTLHPTYIHLKQLRYLSVMGMVMFKAFPLEVSEMTNLEELHLELRNAPLISDSLGKLNKLKSLYLYDCNKIKRIPSSFVELKSLSYLYLSGDRNAIDVSALSALKQDFSLHLVRCNYVGIIEQLQAVPNFVRLILPTDVLPAEMKKIELIIPSDKIIIQNL